jgi:hypothetical protein
MPADAKWLIDRYEVGIASGPCPSDDLPMKGLLVVVLWALAGSYVGGLIERVTGLGMTFPVLAAFVVAGMYLAVRITRATRSATVTHMLRAADPNERLAA